MKRASLLAAIITASVLTGCASTRGDYDHPAYYDPDRATYIAYGAVLKVEDVKVDDGTRCSGIEAVMSSVIAADVTKRLGGNDRTIAAGAIGAYAQSQAECRSSLANSLWYSKYDIRFEDGRIARFRIPLQRNATRTIAPTDCVEIGYVGAEALSVVSWQRAPGAFCARIPTKHDAPYLMQTKQNYGGMGNNGLAGNIYQHYKSNQPRNIAERNKKQLPTELLD